MKNSSTHAPSSAIEANPHVEIVYRPHNSLIEIGRDGKSMLAKLDQAKITSLATLENSSEILTEAAHLAEGIESFRRSLCDRVAEAAQPFRKIPGFEDFEITVTVRRWGLRTMLESAISNLRGRRAKYLADEQEKQRRAQLEAEAEQRRRNEEAAKKAAAEAKKAGADKETIAEIKQDVLATPAPLVQSKAIDTAKAAGVTIVWRYYPKITNLREFLEYCCKNDVMLNTLEGAASDIEAAFQRMCTDQKDHFNYPGMTFEKKAGDRARR